MRRSLTTIAAAAALTVALAGCGGGSGTSATKPSSSAASASSTPTEDAAITPASFLKKTGDALTGAGSYAFTTTTTTSGMTITGGGRAVVSGAGGVAVEMTMDVSGQSLTMRVVDGHIYMDGSMAGAAGQWIDLTDSSNPQLAGLGAQFADSADPVSSLAKLPEGSMTVAPGEKTTLDGADVTKYKVTMDVQDLMKVSGQELTQEQIDALGTAATGDMGIIYYIDSKDRPVKATITMGTLMTQEMAFTGFGSQEPIVAPAADTVLSAASLGL